MTPITENDIMKYAHWTLTDIRHALRHWTLVRDDKKHEQKVIDVRDGYKSEDCIALQQEIDHAERMIAICRIRQGRIFDRIINNQDRTGILSDKLRITGHESRFEQYEKLSHPDLLDLYQMVVSSRTIIEQNCRGSYTLGHGDRVDRLRTIEYELVEFHPALAA